MPRAKKQVGSRIKIKERVAHKPPPKPVVQPKPKEIEVTLDQQQLLRMQATQTDDGLVISALVADGYIDGEGDFQPVRRRRFHYSDKAALTVAWAAFEEALWAVIDEEPPPFERPTTNRGEPFQVAPTE